MEKRVIEFRAWNKIDSEMLKWNVINQTAFNCGSGQLMYKIFVSNRENFELMQYIGVIDKFGNKIYEGDILKGNFGTGGGGDSTKYKSFNFSISYYAKSAKFEIDMPKDYKQYRYMPYLNQCEIIGNIYENANLLK